MNARLRLYVLAACLVVAAFEAPRAGRVFAEDLAARGARLETSRALAYDLEAREPADESDTQPGIALARR